MTCVVFLRIGRPPRSTQGGSSAASEVYKKQGEDPVSTARRELVEEVGCTAQDWSVLVDVVSSPGFSDEAVRVFLASGLTVITGMFPNSVPLPSSLKLSQEKMTFTLSDALVLLIACKFGVAACIFVAGIEGLTSSRRAVRRLSSNLFSFGMMSLAAAAAAASRSS